MDPVLCVSPHCDDSVLSTGQFIASYPGATVLTVFAGSPDPLPPLTSYDASCGYHEGDDVVGIRRDEDRRALRMLRAHQHTLDFLDEQYRQGAPQPVEPVATAIGEVLAELRPWMVVLPLGLGHPDHVTTRDAALLACESHDGDLKVVVYEELPYRVLEPEQAVETVAKLRADGRDPQLTFIGVTPKEAKERAVAFYRSQLRHLDLNCVWVPERYWEVRR